jgi:hypothetical protein
MVIPNLLQIKSANACDVDFAYIWYLPPSTVDSNVEN